jgi:hypothetical protein
MARAASGVPAGSPHRGRWIAMSAAAAVLVMAAAATTLALGHHPSGGGSPPAGASGTVRATSPSGPASTPTATPTAVVANGYRVAVATGAARSSHARLVVLVLTRYFAAINAHDYQAYRRLFSAPISSRLSQAAFTAGYGTTRDSLAELRRIDALGAGRLAAVVTFISHQQPRSSPSQSPCTSWRITLYLMPAGNGYLLQAPPAGYRASFRACP